MGSIVQLPYAPAKREETRYIDTADCAKLIRKALKEAFPEIKFSVKISRYSGGSSIQVKWTGGPTSKQVDAVAKVFQGSRFEGMDDSTHYLKHRMNGELTHFCANYVFCERETDYSKKGELAQLFDKAGREAWLSIYLEMGVDSSAALRILDSYAHTAEDAAYYLLSNLPAPKFDGRKSATAESVVFVSES